MPTRTDSWVRHKMVGWYDPFQLLRTAKDVIVSALVGTRADYRLLESLAAPQRIFDDYSSESEMWIDYVADLGDGWDSTYTIACLLAAPSLAIACSGEPAKTFQTVRGRILVMGGDEVYPTASRERYLERTLGPYQCALWETDPPHPNLFAMPGNHDWYDGLVSFSRLFCQERWFGGWKTRQKRSYFAIQLPHRWWLWGVDIQLESDIDQTQLEYFRNAATKIQAGDRVILATAEPHWIYGNIYDPKLQNNLAFLEEKVIKKVNAKLQVLLAGDLHHYRRHEAADDSQLELITSGGGGAFLHPTFGPPVDQIRVGSLPGMVCNLKSEFPDQETSKRLLRRDFAFAALNPKFGLLTGILYLMIGHLLGTVIQGQLLQLAFVTDNVLRALRYGLSGALGSSSALFWIVLVVLGFIAFTDTHKKLYRFVAGTLHATTHLLALLLIAWLALRVWDSERVGLVPGSLTQKWLVGLSLFVGGYFAGSFLMGLYLYVSLRLFRRHANEAFSALHIPDYKNFLRLHIDQEGNLTIFPIGVEKVPRDWERSKSRSKSDPQLVPVGGAEIKPFLIEPPVEVK